MMPQDRMMQAIGRIERALARLEKIDIPAVPAPTESGEILQRYNRLRAETQGAISAMDALLRQGKTS
jgi:hypothetical protein